MHEYLSNSIEAWEDEGGAVLAASAVSSPMTGTAAQVEWAGRIKDQVNNEFDRVNRLFRSIAGGQNDDKRIDTVELYVYTADMVRQAARKSFGLEQKPLLSKIDNLVVGQLAAN